MFARFSPVRSLSSRMVLVTLSIALIAMLSLTLVTNNLASNNVFAATQQQIDTQAINGVERVERYLADRLASVRLFAQLPLIIVMLSEQNDPEARARGQAVIDAARESYDYVAVSLLDIRGRVVLSTDEAILGQDRGTRPEIRSGLNGVPTISDVGSEPNSNEISIHFIAPVYGANRTMIGLVDVRTDLDSLHALVDLDTDRSGAGSYSVLLDEHGIRLSVPSRPELLLRPANPLPEAVRTRMISEQRFGPATANLLAAATDLHELSESILALQRNRSEQEFFAGELNANVPGESVIRPMRSMPWYYVHRVPTDQFYESVHAQTNLALVLTLIATVLAIVVTVLVMRWSLNNPLNHLVETVSAVAQGDLQRRINVERQDEIGILAQRFNSMADTLLERISEANTAKAEAQRLQEAEAQGRAELEQTVAEYQSFVQAVAQGNLAQRLNVRTNGSLGQLGHGLNEMVESLTMLTGQLRRAAADIASAASEILAATTQQAASATEQVSAVTQTSATVEQVKQITRYSDEQATRVAEDGQAALKLAREGTTTVEESIQGMNQVRDCVESIAQTIMALAEQTQAIGTITTSVSEIADQSNLLALNAAIEAARAGEQGKSFAVVAQNVRALAERSKAATVQVRDILNEIQKASNAAVMVTEEGTRRVEQGSGMITRAGDLIHRIAAEVETGTQTNVQMASGARQAVSGLEQVVQAITSIQQATQQTLSSTRQAERAAQDLSNLAKMLQETVAAYRLAEK
ncbi:methyl-accepting chemotaxis protein [Candidatus Viridilinea mediisalina]|uniref:Chemotaxis protein n=1 Tax=Candidatus Viridilinea mediisalina TaxID=2024553 RepID=A0A2A6RJ14_9CHLR|nr:methyl-accepting chemotaxis protein [Candidatus Viridilinea mediisalina]PDW02840.1 chemotaxis protein [Candidatus Viridilinea mediisalina]